VVVDDVLADALAEVCVLFLVEPEVDAAVNAWIAVTGRQRP
jgi:hypothetical protein